MAATPDSDRQAPSPNEERLRKALGWDELPEMTPEQQAAFDEANEQVQAEARRFYGIDAA